MTCIRPAGRRGACSCGNQYAQILDRLDTVEQEASDAKTTAQTAANTASIQAANAAADAAQAASDAGDALTQATAAAASAAAAALDAADAAADLASINSTISSTLTTYLGTKVDKLSTTGSFAYTHTNATQGETALVDGTTSNTIPIRDGNGRMQAADPASGATDKTLTTANWVSQTGSGRPNNLIHDGGNETMKGIKDPEFNVLNAMVRKDNSTVSSSTWRKLYTMTSSSSGSNRHVRIRMPNTRNCSESVVSIMWGGLSGAPTCYIENSIIAIEVRVCRRTDGNLEVWTNDHVYAYVEIQAIRTGGLINIVTPDLSPSDTTEPIVGPDYANVVTPTVIS